MTRSGPRACTPYVGGTADEGRVVIMAALNLYLDFINMFLFLLRIFGSSRN